MSLSPYNSKQDTTRRQPHHIFSETLSLFLGLLLLFSLPAVAQIKVGVFLPFKSQGMQQQNSVEFYRGLLMAIDSLSQEDASFTVVAADAGQSKDDIISCIDEARNGVFDIIFGPSNQAQAEALNQYSILNGTKLVFPLGLRYDELISNPNCYALKVTQTDFTPQAYKLIQSTFRGYNIVLVSTNDGKSISPFANYLTKYVKGTKTLQWPKKEAKIIEAMNDPRTLIVPTMYDEQTQENIYRLALRATQLTQGRGAAIIGYPSWFERAIDEERKAQLSKMNAYLIQPFFPRLGEPRVKKFIANYIENFSSQPSVGQFSFSMWGFDAGYYLLKGLARHSHKFYDQTLYAAPLQSAFRFEPRSAGTGLINTSVLLIHYKRDCTMELVESK